MWSGFVAGVFVFLFNIQHSTGVDPSFFKEPASRSTFKGSSVTFECQINNVAQPVYFWLKDGNNVTTGTVSLSGSLSSLQLNRVTFSDSGNYSCVAVNNQTGDRWQSGIGTLTVKGKADIIQPPNVISTYIGQSALFHCVAVGDPHPTVGWTNASGSFITPSARFQVFSNGSLGINNAQKSDSGLYICVAQNSYGRTLASATLQVNDPPSLPSFTTRPVSQTAVEGDRVTFYCEAAGNPAPAITWSKSGGQIPPDRREEPSLGSLRIVDLQSGDDGTYVCTAQNSQGSVTTQAFLRIQGYPRITLGPSDKVVTENSSIQFPCVIEGDPAPFVKWTLPNGTIFNSTSHSSGDITVLTNNSLVISDVKGEAAGEYTCSAVNNIGERSMSATLTVLTVPRFSSPLNNMTGNIGGQLSVECEVCATPASDYQWLFNGSIISRERSLNLTLLSRISQGFYMCLANNSLGSVSSVFYLRIQEPPQFVTFPRNRTVSMGQTASFPCSARGDPEPSVMWYRSGDLITGDAHFIIQSNGTLLVKDVTNEHTGWFTCRAVNLAGSAEEKAFLLVADLPVFTTEPSNISLGDGSSATLPCRARGPDAPHITWMIQDSSGGERNVSRRAVVEPSGDLKYSAVTPSDRGLHVCRACNSAGCSSAVAFLNVLFAPSFPVPPKPVGVLQGQDAVLECKPESNPPAVITWTGPNSQSLSGTGYQYIVRNVQPRDVGEYTCMAENSQGSSDVPIQLSIGTKADIKDFNQRPSSLSNIKVQCIVDGTPPPLVTWYLQNVLLPNKAVFPKFDVTPDRNLFVPAWSIANNSFVCNCTNPHASVARLARIPAAPSEVQVTRVMETAVEVSWKKSDPLDLVLQYQLEIQSREGVWKSVNSSVQGTSLHVDNLTSFTVYTFRVRAVNGLGTGVYSQLSQNVTTLEGAPSVPRQLELTVKNASVMNIKWMRPAHLNGRLSNVLYRITYMHFGNLVGNLSGNFTVPHSLVGSPQNFTLKDLLPFTLYVVRVYAGRRRIDGVERWSDSVLKATWTLQLVPLTPPVDLTVAANGPYQIMAKWKVPPYSILGYHIWYSEYESSKLNETGLVPRMEDTVYLITDLKPDTQYQVKARMYSSAGIGPFSDLRVVTTAVDALAVTSGLSGEDGTTGLTVAIACFVVGFLLLILIGALFCFRRRSSRQSRQSFHIRNVEDPALKYVVKRRNDSNLSAGDDSEGSMEGQYNFAHNDDEIDVVMFAGDRNSAHYLHDDNTRYLDPAQLNFTDPASSGAPASEQIRLENYKPRLSPNLPRRDQLVYADLDLHQTVDRNSDSDVSEDSFTDDSEEIETTNNETMNTQTDAPQYFKEGQTANTLGKSSSEAANNGPLTNGSLVGDTSHDTSHDEGPPEWLPPPPLTSTAEFPTYAQVDPKRKKGAFAKGSIQNTTNGPVTNGPTLNGDTSEDDDPTDWFPPPPPPPTSSHPPEDSDWERPLPPEIMALPGKRNRVASWARDKSDGANNNGVVTDQDPYTNI